MSYDPTQFEQRVAIARERFAAIIAADAYLAGAPAIPVITQRVGNIAAVINEALSRLGICVVVVAADAEGFKRKGKTKVMEVRLVAQVSEKVLLAEAAAQRAAVAYRPADAVMLRIIKAVDEMPNGLDPAGGRHIPGINEFAVLTDRPFELVKTTGDVVYEVSAHTTIEL